MKRIQLLVSILILNAQLSYSQDAESLFKKGDSLYKIKDYKNSAIAYSAGIKIQGKQTDESNYWRAASRWALAKVPDSTRRSSAAGCVRVRAESFGAQR